MFEVVLSAGKVVLTFCDFQGVLLFHFQKPVEIVSDPYCTVLQILADSVRRKRLGLLSRRLLTA